MRRALLIFSLVLALPATVNARDYGQRGTVFPVVERDLLQQIQSRLTGMEASGETARLNEELVRRVARVVPEEFWIKIRSKWSVFGTFWDAKPRGDDARSQRRGPAPH